jgi:chlorobactene glucosyltransferase
MPIGSPAKRSSPTVAILSPDRILYLVLAVTAAEWLRRALWMRQFGLVNAPLLPSPAPVTAVQPKVSVIVPAKNEERNIIRCLSLLARQDYPDYELIVVDDRSDDRTGHLLENFKKITSVPMKIVRVEKLPPGWTGKNHAMTVGSKAASGEWFLFTDADTSHSAHSLSCALRTADEQKLDFLTLAPQVQCVSFWENVVQTLAVSSLALWFNSADLNKKGSKRVLANGQFILVKRSVYESVGGNESVKSEVVEDVEFAKKVKQAGYELRFLNGTRLYSTRMYTSLAQIYRGWTRIYVHLFEKKLLPIFHKIFLFLFFSLLPFAVWCLESGEYLAGDAHFNAVLWVMATGICAMIIAVRFVGNLNLRSDPWYAFLHPLGSLIMVWILGACIFRIVFNRPSVWRGDLHH